MWEGMDRNVGVVRNVGRGWIEMWGMNRNLGKRVDRYVGRGLDRNVGRGWIEIWARWKNGGREDI